MRWYPVPVFDGSTEIGHASSVAWSPTLRKLIGFGHLKQAFGEVGTQVTLRCEDDGTTLLPGSWLCRSTPCDAPQATEYPVARLLKRSGSLHRCSADHGRRPRCGQRICLLENPGEAMTNPAEACTDTRFIRATAPI
ncbi:glycine cleavage T C-terminal barrel domain-containing protein [Sinorhizobium sp. GL28]|uniref:glycine cleavage T C-terminal barrel domain-containing protein n=1 Tax=Sinorhizobium sp. GL28 TaxID=1358418 RepID=UPI000AB8DC0C|nr:glycine cleavage T C-terminal barrel domain-containing protein [Sinorhizobium sp. GL28]